MADAKISELFNGFQAEFSKATSEVRAAGVWLLWLIGGFPQIMCSVWSYYSLYLVGPYLLLKGILLCKILEEELGPTIVSWLLFLCFRLPSLTYLVTVRSVLWNSGRSRSLKPYSYKQKTGDRRVFVYLRPHSVLLSFYQDRWGDRDIAVFPKFIIKCTRETPMGQNMNTFLINIFAISPFF